MLKGTSYLETYKLTCKSYFYLNGKLKRALDIVGSSLGILIGFPIFLLAVCIVKIVDRVPALFIQERFGRQGQALVFIKLRTLGTIEVRDDVNKDRIQRKPDYETTLTGKFWRVTSIDEIIQFWLVLKGDMSLIGYRPFPTYYLPHLAQIDGMDEAKFDHYLTVIKRYKPGMSSLASVNGRGNLTMQEKMEYDLIYGQNATFWWDIVLLFRTLFVVFTQEGAK